jgi:5-methylcytosine-specific restriction protein A
MSLNGITREAVLAAIAEYDRLGQEEFLNRYGFDRARQYVLVHDGKRYDSKAIVGVAHGFLPEKTVLAASEFSGGKATVGQLLAKLGFTVENSDEEPTDTLVRQLANLRVYLRDGLPALYQPITLLWAFARARRGEDRLVSWAETKRQVGFLLGRYGQADEGDRVHYPVAALCGAGLWELDTAPEIVPPAHGSSVPQRWFDERQPNGGLVDPVYTLIRESPEALAAAANVLVEKYFVDTGATQLLAELGLSEPVGMSPAVTSFAERAAEYKRLCMKVDVFWRDRDETRADRTSSLPVRAQDARSAVLLRSEGHCESPRCTGEIQDHTDKGGAILEVDHIHDLALGGPDDPSQMIALCPNCHAIKTRGSTRHELKGVLTTKARQRHDELSKS